MHAPSGAFPPCAGNHAGMESIYSISTVLSVSQQVMLRACPDPGLGLEVRASLLTDS